MRNFVFWGGTGHSIGLSEILSYSEDKIVAIFDNNRSLKSPFENVPLYFGKEGFENWLSSHDAQETYFAAAIAGWNNIPRLEYHEYLKGKGLKPATLVHPAAFVAKTPCLVKPAIS